MKHFSQWTALRKVAKKKCKRARSQIVEEQYFLQTLKGICPSMVMVCAVLGWFQWLVLWPLMFVFLFLDLYATDRHAALWEAYDTLTNIRQTILHMEHPTKKQLRKLEAELEIYH